MSNEKICWEYFRNKGLNDYAIAGILGNLFAESGLRSNNLQNSFEDALNMNDIAYMVAVDSGEYTNFVRDSAGWGICQWTYWSRKQALLAFAKAAGKSIGDLHMQLDFLWKELTESYPGVLAVLRSATSVLEASNAVLLNFEKPASKDTIETQTRRASYGQMYYDQFATQQEELSLVEFKELYRVMRSELQDNDAGEWSAEARQWAVGHGLVAGSGTKINGQPNYMWQDLLTREQLVTMLYRFAEMMR